MAYTVREYQPEQDKSAVVTIIQDVWKPATVTRFLKHHDWLQSYYDCVVPSSDKSIVIEKAGKLVGFSRLTPTSYKLGAVTVNAVHLADSVTHSQYRGCGIKLFRHIVQVDGRLETGIPVERAGLLWEKVAKRPVVIRVVSRYVLMLKPSVFLQKKGLPLVLGSIVDQFWTLRLLIKNQNKFNRKKEVLHASHIAKIPSKEEYDFLMKRFVKGFYAIALREYAFFNWRFFASPIRYQYVWLRTQNELVGYCVYRKCQLNGRAVLLIVDIVAVGDQKSIYGEIIRLLTQEAIEKKYTDIQTIETGCSALSSVLKKVGAVCKKGENELLAYVSSDKPYATEMYDHKEWYLSLAENDYEFVMYPCTENEE